MKYLLCRGTLIQGREDRPTQAELKTLGIGEYALYRSDDGTQIKQWVVQKNRNGNLTVIASNPAGLLGVRSHVLTRMLRAYKPIVKAWPVQEREVRKIQAEVSRRAELLFGEHKVHDANTIFTTNVVEPAIIIHSEVAS